MAARHSIGKRTPHVRAISLVRSPSRSIDSQRKAEKQLLQKQIDCKTIAFSERKRLKKIEWQLHYPSSVTNQGALMRERASTLGEEYVPTPVANVHIRERW